jgi:hypothetical protein
VNFNVQFMRSLLNIVLTKACKVSFRDVQVGRLLFSQEDMVLRPLLTFSYVDFNDLP